MRVKRRNTRKKKKKRLEGMPSFKAKDYIDPRHSYAFGRKETVASGNPQDTKEHIAQELSKSEIHTRNRKHRRPVHFIPNYTRRKRHMIEADTAYVKRDRYGYRYVLCFIDDFTRFTWVYPLKAIGSGISVNCLENVIEEGGQVPNKLYTDRGTEFTGSVMRDYCTAQGIKHILSYQERKCPIVERFIRSLKDILEPMTQALKQPWSTLLVKANNIYLNREHRSIGMSPREAELTDSAYHLWWMVELRSREADARRQEPKFAEGQTVRVYQKKLGRQRTFKRGYTPSFSPEIFRIRKVLPTLPLARYLLAGAETGVEVEGRSFFQDELVLAQEEEEEEGGEETPLVR